LQISNEQAGMRFARGPEILFDAEMDSHLSRLEPHATTLG
jgi:hypothetical protein